MKSLVSGMAFIILLVCFNHFQVEQDAFIRAQEHVKVLCNDSAAAGVLFTLDDAYAVGNREFDIPESEAVINRLIRMNMDLNANLEPNESSYWKDTVHYSSYYFDDSGFVTTYMDGSFTSRQPFSYGSIFIEPSTGYKKLINETTVIVSISIPYPAQNATWIKWPKIVRSSAYEDLDRD